jgi:two-component system osmolarity sensor histidine kinase EnvZ
MMPKSLFGRAVILIIAPMALLQTILVFIFLDRHLSDITRRFAGGIAGETALLADAYDKQDDPADFNQLNAMVSRHLGLIATIEPKRSLPAPPILGPFSVVRRQVTNDLAERLGRVPLVYSSDDPTYIEIFVELDKGVLHVLAPRARLRTATTNLLLYWMMGLTIMLVGVAILFLRNQIRPIVRLTVAAENFGRGVDDIDFKPTGATEIRRAGAAFIEMRQRIRRQIEQRTTMLAAVSHDLRTPLTRIKLELEMMPQSAEVDDIKADVAEIEHMVRDYLAFTQDQTIEESAPQDLVPFLNDLCESTGRHGQAVSLRIAAVKPGDLVIRFRRNALKRCLSNLLDNAKRYARTIAVHVSTKDGLIVIAVEDDGPGIADDLIETAMSPFSRLDPARDPNKANVGLGLAISRDIARSHGGDLILDRSALGGLRAQVQLPARL